MLQEAEHLFRTPNCLSAQVCWEMAADKARAQRWRVWSYRKTALHLRHKLPVALQIVRRHGRKAFTDEAESWIERDKSGMPSNALWESDHHWADVLCKVGKRVHRQTGEVKIIHGRPWITPVIAVASGKILAAEIYYGDPSSDPIILAIRSAVMEFGVPDEFAFDAGKDFDRLALNGRTKKERLKDRLKVRETIDAPRINGIITTLGSKVPTVQSYHGQSKIIERRFRAFKERHDQRFATYTGGNPNEQPEGLQGRLDAGKAPTVEEYAASLHRWIVEDFNHMPSRGDGMEGKSPNEVYAERRRDRKAQLAYSETRLRIHEDLPDRMARIAGKRNAERARSAGDPPPVPNIRPIRSPLEVDLPAVHSAIEARKAGRAGRAAGAMDAFDLVKALEAYTSDREPKDEIPQITRDELLGRVTSGRFQYQGEEYTDDAGDGARPFVYQPPRAAGGAA